MKYKLITGFYPSINTCNKVIKKVKGNCTTVHYEQYERGYMVVLAESDDYSTIDELFSKYMKMNIYCGILPEHI